MHTKVAAESHTLLDAREEDALYSRIVRRTVPLFFTGFVLSYLDRVNISLAKLQMQADFGLSEHAFAIGASIFFWGYMLFEVPSNLLLQRVGARAWIARIMFTWGIVSMMMIFSRNQTAFYSLRLLLGICEAGFVPGVMYYTNTWLPARRQSRMYSVFLMALPVSIMLGAPLSGGILQSMQGIGGLKGWQWLFVLEGLPSVVLGVAILLLLKNKPNEAAWLTDEEKVFVVWNVSREAKDKAHRFSDALKSKSIYTLIAIMLLFNTAFYGMTLWLPTVFRNAGITNDFHVGLYTAAPFGVAAVAMYITARMAERTGRQRLLGTAGVLMASAGLFLATYAHERFWFALAMLTLAASGILALMPIYWALPGRILCGAAAAAGLALINSVGSLSGVMGSLIIGYAGVQTGMYILAASLAACGFLFYESYPKAGSEEPS
jgi:MFS family permease